jgi:hypothetical protein
VVIIDVNNVNQQTVVQGNITNDLGPYIINLNYTTAYYNDNTFPPISGADVSIFDNAGNNETLKETKEGVYKTDSLKGIPGRIYTLQISTNGVSYTAVSSMPLSVPIDSILLVPDADIKKNTIKSYKVTCKFTDPDGSGNFYRVLINSTDTAANQQSDYRIVSDKLTDGQQIAVTSRISVHPSDIALIQLQCIDQATFDFYRTLRGAVGTVSPGQFLGSLPANPNNNISNKGLGYFAAYSVTTNTLVVP